MWEQGPDDRFPDISVDEIKELLFILTNEPEIELGRDECYKDSLKRCLEWCVTNDCGLRVSC